MEAHKNKSKARVFAVLAVILIATWDEIAGRAYLYHLCTTEAGEKVHRQVQLPAEYWDEQGRPVFLKPNGDLDNTKLGNKFSERVEKTTYSKVFKIDEYRRQVVDSRNSETLGEVINFLYWGGWALRMLPLHPSALDCGHLHGKKFWSDFYLSLFIDRDNSMKKLGK